MKTNKPRRKETPAIPVSLYIESKPERQQKDNRSREFTATQAARELGIHTDTLKRWISAKKVADVARRPNGYRVFTQSDLDAIRKFMDSRIQPGGSRPTR